jgi:hypothetical protein
VLAIGGPFALPGMAVVCLIIFGIVLLTLLPPVGLALLLLAMGIGLYLLIRSLLA